MTSAQDHLPRSDKCNRHGLIRRKMSAPADAFRGCEIVLNFSINSFLKKINKKN